MKPGRVNKRAGIMQISQIKAATAAEYEISLAQLLSTDRSTCVSHPRMVAMTLSRELTSRSLPDIGKQFSRDHTTVLNAIRRVNKIPALRNAADKIASELGAVETPDWRKHFGLQFLASKWIGDGLRGFA